MENDLMLCLAVTTKLTHANSTHDDGTRRFMQQTNSTFHVAMVAFAGELCCPLYFSEIPHTSRSYRRRRLGGRSSVALSILAAVLLLTGRLRPHSGNRNSTTFTSGAQAYTFCAQSFPQHDQSLRTKYGWRSPSARPRARDSPCRWRDLQTAWHNCIGFRLAEATDSRPHQISTPGFKTALLCSAIDHVDVAEGASMWQSSAKKSQLKQESTDIQQWHIASARATPRKATRAMSSERKSNKDKLSSKPRPGQGPEILDEAGQELPFEFGHFQEAIRLPCSLQLVPKTECSSIVYVNGTEVDHCADSSGARGKSQGGFSSKKVAVASPVAMAASAMDEAPVGSPCTDELGATVPEDPAARREEQLGIRLVGEMAISRPAYLQMKEGSGGNPDTLLVSQFGLTRAGAVTSIDLNPQTSSSPSRRAASSELTAVAAAVLNTRRRRPKPKLKGIWTGPLLWPNEVNQVPPLAAVRLVRGKDAEQHYLAQLEGRRKDDRQSQSQSEAIKSNINNAFRARVADASTTNPNKPLEPREDGNISFPTATSCSSSTSTDGMLPDDAMLVADGFLMPGKADGGVYIIRPTDAEDSTDIFLGESQEKMSRLTGIKRGWFYHKAVWLALPGGKKFVLTARVRKPIFGQAEGQLVLLEMPQVERPLAEHNLPWREIVLVEGPDVMFEVVDMDPSDETVEVVCAEFFGGRLTMHSIWGGNPAYGSRPSVTESWVLDDNAGPAYSVTAADLSGSPGGRRPTHFLVTTHECTYDQPLFPSFDETLEQAGACPEQPPTPLPDPSAQSSSASDHDTAREGPGDHLVHGFVDYPRAHWEHPSNGWTGGVEPSGKASRETQGLGGIVTGPLARGGRRGYGVGGQAVSSGGSGGGSLIAYEVPKDWRVYPVLYPSPGWRRVTLASGFRVRGLSINPGAPGFAYTFHPHKSMEGKQMPYIALAGDCSQAAYILRPRGSALRRSPRGKRRLDLVPPRNDSPHRATVGVPEADPEIAQRDNTRVGLLGGSDTDMETGEPISYDIACVIELPGTVGSLAVSYGSILGEGDSWPDLRGAARDQGWAKLFVPNYDGNRVFIFSMEDLS